jgi:hypothetical protein
MFSMKIPFPLVGRFTKDMRHGADDTVVLDNGAPLIPCHDAPGF